VDQQEQLAAEDPQAALVLPVFQVQLEQQVILAQLVRQVALGPQVNQALLPLQEPLVLKEFLAQPPLQELLEPLEHVVL